MSLRAALLCLFVSWVLTSWSQAEPVSFSRQIAPILLENCQACHGAKRTKGGYRVDTFEEAVGEGDSGIAGFVAGDLKASEAFQRIVSDDEDERMPLDRDPLSRDQIELLTRWIQQGAKFDGVNPKAQIATLASGATQPDPPEQYRHPIPVTALHFSHDGSELFVGGYHEVTVWSGSEGKLVRRIRNVGQRTMGLDLSTDGRLLAVAGGAPGRSGSVRVFDALSGELKKVTGSCGDLVLDVQYSPDSKRLAATTIDSGVQIFDAGSGALQLSINKHADWVNAVSWSPDGTRLVTASRDKSCKVFDSSTGKLSTTYGGHGNPVKGVAFLPDGLEVFSSGGDKKVHRWKIADGAKVAEIGFGNEVFKLPSVDTFLFAVSADKTVRQIEAKTNKEVRKFEGHVDWALTVDFHSGMQRLASGGHNGMIRIWDTSDGSEVVSFIAAPGYIRPK